jgi:DNA-directed RNA polymerase subunit K/omega
MSNVEIKAVNLADLSAPTENLYKSVVIIGQRSNQVATQLKQELNSKIAEFATTGDSFEEIVENREQVEIAKIYEGMPKPALIAINEFLEGKVEHHEL